MSAKQTIHAAVFITMVFGTLTYAQEKRTKPTTLEEAIYGPVQRLFEWPDAGILNGPKRVPADDPTLPWPKRQCGDWIERVLAPSWRPPEGTETIFLKGEIDDRDVVRMSWESNGYRIAVSQTASIFTIKLTPMDGKDTGKTEAQKIAAARAMCLKIFPEKGRRHAQTATAPHLEVSVQNLAEKIALWSFEPEKVRHLETDDAVMGHPRDAREANVRPAQTDAERAQVLDANNPEWEKSSRSFDYWFRMIHWWNDGRSIGFYFLKVEEGAWLPSYDAQFDKKFFKIVGPHHKPGKGDVKRIQK